jgi:hypothetical protein
MNKKCTCSHCHEIVARCDQSLNAALHSSDVPGVNCPGSYKPAESLICPKCLIGIVPGYEDVEGRCPTCHVWSK